MRRNLTAKPELSKFKNGEAKERRTQAWPGDSVGWSDCPYTKRLRV